MNHQPQIVSTFYFSPASQELLREANNGGEVICFKRGDDYLPALREAEIFCGPYLPENWRELAPRLRWLQYPGAGLDRLNGNSILDADSGVHITNASGIHITSISEYVFASMLMFNRSWPVMVELQRQHIWPGDASLNKGEKYQLRERELGGRTLGIVGLGNIGRRIAQVARAFGMQVLATSFSAREHVEDLDVDQLYPLSQLHTLLGKSDYVVLAMPLTAKTEKMIGEPELRAMRSDTYLVNIARGKVVDEAALIRALQEGWIAGAGLDVTTEEPLPPESPLYDLPNVILTPHLSGGSEHYDKRLAALFADNLRRYLAGQQLRNLYDPLKGY